MTYLQITNSQPPQKATEIKSESLQTKIVADGALAKKSVDDNNKTNAMATEQAKEESLQQLQDKVSEINNYMQNIDRSLQFTIDEKSGSSVVIVRDSETDEIIRQFPSDEILNARSAISQDETKGILVKATI